MANYRKAKKGGGIGGILAVLVVVGLLGAVAYIAWNKTQDLKNKPKPASGPKELLQTWMSRREVMPTSPLPAKLEDDCQLALESTMKIRIDGLLYPVAWADVLREKGEFTAVMVGVYRKAPDETPRPYGLFIDLAGDAEGKQLRGYIADVEKAELGLPVEKETANYRFLGWRSPDETDMRSRIIVVAKKNAGPKTDELLAREKQRCLTTPKRKLEAAPAPAAPSAPAPAAQQ